MAERLAETSEEGKTYQIPPLSQGADLNNAMNKKGYSAILSEQGMHSQRWKAV